jgi:hypothetical protein
VARFLHEKRSLVTGSDPTGCGENPRHPAGAAVRKAATCSLPTQEETLHNATKYGVLLAALALLALPADGFGQGNGKLSLDARVGVSFPAGAMAELTDVGGVAGGSLVWNFHPNWALRADFDYLRLDDGANDLGILVSPPMDLLFFGGSIEVNFNAPKYQDLPLTFTVNVGGGAMSMKVDNTFDAGHPANGFDYTYPTIQGGAKIGYQVSDLINIFVQGTAYLVIIESGDTWVFPRDDTFDHGWVIPVVAGVRLTLLD